FHLVLVHKDNGIPVQLEDRHVNAELVPRFLAQDFEAITPIAYLLSVVPADELEHTVEAMMPMAAELRLLDMPRGVPCLALHRRSWSQGRVVTVATLLYPGKRYTLHSRYRMMAAGTVSGRD